MSKRSDDFKFLLVTIGRVKTSNPGQICWKLFQLTVRVETSFGIA